MKNALRLVGLIFLLAGCSWFGHGNRDRASQEGGLSGADISQGRGTTGVSSGDDRAAPVTGSDAATR